MKRRGFFKALASATAASSVAHASPIKKKYSPVSHPDEMEYGEFRLRWTGWKPNQYNDAFAGQWVARRLDGNTIRYGSGLHSDAIWSGFPGTVDYYQSGMKMNLCPIGEQCMLLDEFSAAGNPYENKEFLEKARGMALAELKDFIRKNHQCR